MHFGHIFIAAVIIYLIMGIEKKLGAFQNDNSKEATQPEHLDPMDPSLIMKPELDRSLRDSRLFCVQLQFVSLDHRATITQIK